MFLVERYLCKLKEYVHNRCHPEACMAEGYLAIECLNFCSRYLNDGVKTRLDRRSARYDKINPCESQTSIFFNVGYPIRGRRNKNGKGFSLDQQSLK